MIPFLIGKKVGMTQVFAGDGTVTPVTVIQAGPCIVIQVKTVKSDGYNAIQIGFDVSKHPNKPLSGHAKAAKVTPQYLREVKVEDVSQYKPGQVLTPSAFTGVDLVTVTGTSKGKGFSGVIKRHNFHRGPETHGSDHHRKPGSIGGMFPQRVLKGQRLPGQMGNARVTVQKLHLIQADDKNNLLIVRGAVPGFRGSVIEITGVTK